MSEASTSWGPVAAWYDDVVQDREGYQQQVLLPHLTRLLALTQEDVVLDLACGSGFFSHAFAKSAGSVIGVDVAPELIALAKRHAARNIEFLVAAADRLPLSDRRCTKVVCVLALQNIQNLEATMLECQRVLAPGGGLYLVLNHPAFRVPHSSSWGFDENGQVQYRRVDKYLSEARAEIVMHPGTRQSETTLSFHRPLQLYMKALRKCGFALVGLEEWISHKKSERGPRAEAEDTARKEIPLFLYMEARKI